MNSIRKKITVCMMATVLIALVVVGGSSIALNYRSTIATVDQMMSETAVLASERIEQELAAYKNVAMDTGCIPQLSDAAVSLAEKRAIIDERVSAHDFQRGNIIGLDGYSIFDGNDYSDREYVRQAMQGNVYVSEPLVSKIYRGSFHNGGRAYLFGRNIRFSGCRSGLFRTAGNIPERHRIFY